MNEDFYIKEFKLSIVNLNIILSSADNLMLLFCSLVPLNYNLESECYNIFEFV